MVSLVVVGGAPATAAEAFAMLRRNRATALLRLDVLTVVFMPAYYVLFAGFYAALRRIYPAYALGAAVLGAIGLTLFLGTSPVSSLAYLGDQYAAADAARQSQLLAAGEATLASDMWHSTAGIAGGMMLQVSCVWICLLMLRSDVFSRATALAGLATNGLDLAHAVAGLFAPTLGFVLMAAAGPLYFVWFTAVGRRFLRLGASPARASS
jgi:hypothetical protein